MVGSELPSPSTEESTVTDRRAARASSDLDARRRRRPPGARRHQPRPSTPARCSASPGSRATARPSWSRPSSACAPDVQGRRHARRRGHHRLADAASAARPASATSPRTGTATGCCSTPRSGRTASSATRPGRRASRAAGSTAAAPASDTERIVEEYDVRTPGIDTTARALSGGNQQKFIVGREMSGDPVAADRRPPDPRRRRRRPGRDLGPHQSTPAARAWRCC